jgi:hypothetical protein
MDTHCRLIGYRPEVKSRTPVTQPLPSLQKPLGMEYYKTKFPPLFSILILDKTK